MSPELETSLKLIYPEMLLLGTILIVILFDLFKSVSKGSLAVLSLAGLLSSGAILLGPLVNGSELHLQTRAIFQGSAAHDGLAIFFKAIFLALGVLTIAFSWPVVRRWSTGQGEFLAILLASVFAMMIMAAANDLLMMFLALEFVSVTSYIMTSVLRRNRAAAEASLKYIIYGSAAAGVMLYGMSYLYGMTGTLQVTEIGTALARSDKGLPISLGLMVSVMIAAGFAYKIAAAPFHMWCPDVYEGAATPVTAFFSIGPKLAGFAMFVRFLWGVFPPDPAAMVFEWKLVIAAMALLTLAFGNFGALYQNNLKRLMAYSGIAHAGYMLLAFVVFDANNIASLMFYSAAYLVMNLGAFIVVIVLEEKYGIETVDGCRGMGWVDPVLGGCMTIFLLSLVGIPPMAGFAAKLLIFGYIVDHSIQPGGDPTGLTMAIVGVIFSAISLYYYARILMKMFLVQPAEPVEPLRSLPVLSSLVVLLAIGTLVLGVWNGWLIDIAGGASRSILSGAKIQ
jgi:NADH-quinone oxidoreductase subunit N